MYRNCLLIYPFFVEQLYIFTVQTINDADDSISNKSQSVACKTKAGGKIKLLCTVKSKLN